MAGPWYLLVAGSLLWLTSLFAVLGAVLVLAGRSGTASSALFNLAEVGLGGLVGMVGGKTIN